MTATRAERERAKLEEERRSMAQKAKDERNAREALLEQRQQARCQSMHHAASTLRATQTAAVNAQKAELQGQRRGSTEESRQHRDALRRHGGRASGILSIRGPEVSRGSPRVGTRRVQSPTPHARALPSMANSLSQPSGWSPSPKVFDPELLEELQESAHAA